MGKYYRGSDGYMAIVISPGYGCGWSTWNNVPEMLYDEDLVKLVLRKQALDRRVEVAEYDDNDDEWLRCSLAVEETVQKIKELAHTKWGDVTVAGADTLKVEWVEELSIVRWKVIHYDGDEQVIRL